MRFRRGLTTVVALGALAVGVTGSAFAQGNPHGTTPGQGGTPPGQGGTPPGQAAKPATPAGQARKAQGKPAPRAAARRNTARPAAKASPRAKARVASRGSRGASQSTTKAGGTAKTTICHRTGSETNPWVLITVANPSLDAHRKHGDIIPASTCPSGARPAGTQPGNAHDKVTICHRTGSDTNPYVVITIARAGWDNGHSKHEGDRILQPGDDPEQLCRSAGASKTGGGAGAGPGGQNGQTTGVAGVKATLGKAAAKPAAKARERGGVLGATARAGNAALRGTLPFTGIPLWLVALGGLALIATGFAVRRGHVRADG